MVNSLLLIVQARTHKQLAEPSQSAMMPENERQAKDAPAPGFGERLRLKR
jgi:hypothetical protein